MRPRPRDLRQARNATAVRFLAGIALVIGLFALSGIERIAYILFFFFVFVLSERRD